MPVLAGKKRKEVFINIWKSLSNRVGKYSFLEDFSVFVVLE